MLTARRLAAQDLAAVVQVDARHVGRRRADFFARRLGAALRAPDLHVQLGVDGAAGLEGFALARLQAGEFGRSALSVRLQAIGVAPEAQGHGVGSALLAGLEAAARKLDASELRTTAAWNDAVMLGFLDRAGFELAENQIVDCAAHLGRLDAEDEEGLERDRADVRTLAAADLDAVTRIDHKLTGRDRRAYIRRQVEDALGDSDIAVSLAAWSDGHVVGFLTARVDFGDSGRTSPVAVLDTIGVDPAFARKGVGRALLSQLFANLSALRVERVETLVAREDFALLGFLYGSGFGGSQRLSFVKRLAPTA